MCLPQTFEHHRELTLANFIVREDLHSNTLVAILVHKDKIATYLEMRRKSELLASPDEPLGRIVLIPFDSVTVIHRELMMEVLVSFTNGDERGKHVVLGSMFVVERCFSDPMSKGVDTESGLQCK